MSLGNIFSKNNAKILTSENTKKKPLHFREPEQCQKPQKWFQKELNWVSSAILSIDKDVDLVLKICSITCEKRQIYV